MMKIDLKDKRIVIPIIIAVGAIALVLILYKEDNSMVIEDTKEINTNIADVSRREQEAPIGGKFEAYDASVKEQRKKYTAMNELQADEDNPFSDEYLYSLDEMQEIENERARKEREKLKNKGQNGYIDITPDIGEEETEEDEDEYTSLMKSLKKEQEDRAKQQAEREENEQPQNSPFDEMKQQYLFLDSLQKASDPELQRKLDKEERDKKILEAIEKNKLSTLKVEKIRGNGAFNSIKRKEEGSFIKAIIDENITGYAGSRLRIRLLEDIMVGSKMLKKNNYLYAIITGFGDQRVKLQIVTVMYENKILPIRLSIYDTDGMEGLFVPASQFREFSKELGDATIQGVSTNSMDGGDTQSQFFTSLASRLFQSTSSAVSKLIRMNKAKLKYNSHIYLVDAAALDETKKEIYEQNKNKQ